MLDAQGYKLTVDDPGAVALFNEAQRNLLEYRLSALPLIKQALAIEPVFVMGNCLRGYMLMMFGTFTVHSAVEGALRQSEASMSRCTRREQLHVKALRAWLAGRQSKALSYWLGILTDYPLDIIALRMHHFVCFWTGRQQALKGTAASVLDMWKPEICQRRSKTRPLGGAKVGHLAPQVGNGGRA